LGFHCGPKAIADLGVFSLSTSIEYHDTGISVALRGPNTDFGLQRKGFICINVAFLLLFINQLWHSNQHLLLHILIAVLTLAHGPAYDLSEIKLAPAPSPHAHTPLSQRRAVIAVLYATIESGTVDIMAIRTPTDRSDTDTCI
jgi:hypothetical protein